MCVGLHFATHEFENEFMTAHLHNNEYYSGAKWMFLFLAVLYVLWCRSPNACFVHAG